MLSFDARALEVEPPTEGAAEPEPPFAIAVTRGGLGFRFSLRPHRDPSTRAGRKYAKLNEGDEVLAVHVADAGFAVLCASSDGHALGVALDEIAVLAGVGKGAMVMKIEEGERVLGVAIARTTCCSGSRFSSAAISLHSRPNAAVVPGPISSTNSSEPMAKRPSASICQTKRNGWRRSVGGASAAGAWA